ncbi:hypothetical protein HDE_00488 [Halotydeus destructor]|nr:hypothetical protein HDE_00488 [Halotydeus destructor]
MSETIQCDKWSNEFYRQVFKLICTLSPMSSMVTKTEAKLRQQRILFANLGLSRAEMDLKKKLVDAEEKLLLGQIRPASNNTKSALLPAHEYLILGRPMVFTHKFNSTEMLDQPKLVINDCCSSDQTGALDSFIRETMQASIDPNKKYHPGCFVFGPRSCQSCENLGISNGDKRDYLECPHSYFRLSLVDGKLKRLALKGHLEMTSVVNKIEYDQRPLVMMHAKDLELLYFNTWFYKYQMQVCSLVLVDRLIVQRALDHIAEESTEEFEKYCLHVPDVVPNDLEINENSTTFRQVLIAQLEDVQDKLDSSKEEDEPSLKKPKLELVEQVDETTDAK